MKKLIVSLSLLCSSALCFANTSALTCANAVGHWHGVVNSESMGNHSQIRVFILGQHFSAGSGNLAVYSQDGNESTQNFTGTCRMIGGRPVEKLEDGQGTDITIDVKSSNTATLSGMLWGYEPISDTLSDGKISK